MNRSRQVIVSNLVSLDGFMAGPAGEIDWFANLPGKEFDECGVELIGTIDTMLLLALGIASTTALRLVTSERSLGREPPPGTLPAPVRVAAGVSLEAWLAVLPLGRLIGYFHAAAGSHPPRDSRFSAYG